MANHTDSPFSDKIEEEIEAEQKTIHAKYWPQISALEVPSVLEGDDVPIRQNRKLLRLVGWYARDLFEVEARRYPDPPKEIWLTALAEETSRVVLGRLQYLELDYHASEEEITKAVFEALRKRANAHLSVLGPVPIVDESSCLPRVEEHANPRAPIGASVNRRALGVAYLAKFQNEKVKILDVCWAARQHYREWKRWMAGQLRDGSTADLAFRRILSSDKRPSEYRTDPRPPKWQ